MDKRYILSEFYKGNEFEIAFTEIQRYDHPKINSENIFITCLHPSYPKKGSKKEKIKLDEWLNIFNKLTKVKRLKIHVYNQDIFNGLTLIPNLEELYIESSEIEDLSNLKEIKKLLRVHIRCNSKIKNIEPWTRLELKYLLLEECFNVSNYEEIGKIKSLIGLSLNGKWTQSKNLKIKSLKPFEKLKNLKHLNLEFTSIEDESFKSILKMKNLVRFDYLNKVDKELKNQIIENHNTLKTGSFF